MKQTVIIFLLLFLIVDSKGQFHFLDISLNISGGHYDSYNAQIKIHPDSTGHELTAILSRIILDSDSTIVEADTQYYKVSEENVNRIGNQLKKLSASKIFNGMFINRQSFMVLDGNNCILEYGTYHQRISFIIDTPTLKTKERHLSLFYNLCRELLILGKINPEILLN
jgi:hypothetical protein